jgi:hypothetical protein
MAKKCSRHFVRAARPPAWERWPVTASWGSTPCETGVRAVKNFTNGTYQSSRGKTLSSASTVGRMLKRLIERGRVIPVPVSRNAPKSVWAGATATPNPSPRPRSPRAGRTRPDRHPVRQPCARKPIKHFTAYDPVPKWTLGHVSNRSLGERRQSPPCQAHRCRSLRGQRGPARRRIRVHGRFRRPLPHKLHRAHRPTAQTADLDSAVERAQCSSRYEFYASLIEPAGPHRQAPRSRPSLAASMLPTPPGS